MPSRTAVIRRTSLALFAVAWCSGPQRALACPDCSVSRVVRASVFDGSFGTHLWLIALPLVVLAAICVLLYRIGRPAGRAERARAFPCREIES
jgi:hypothetical protein